MTVLCCNNLNTGISRMWRTFLALTTWGQRSGLTFNDRGSLPDRGGGVLLWSPGPTYQLWPVSSAKEIIPKCHLDPPEWISRSSLNRPFSWHFYFFKRKPWISRNFPAFSRRRIWAPKSRLGEDEVDMSGSDVLWGIPQIFYVYGFFCVPNCLGEKPLK